jgi:hypothetical protein
MFSYRLIFKKALALSWRHKYLWIFGLFASLTVIGGSLESQFITEGLGQSTEGSFLGAGSLMMVVTFLNVFILGIASIFQQNILLGINALTVIILLLTFIFLLAWLAVSSQAAIVDAVKKITASQKKEINLNWLKGMRIGSQKFWPVLGLNVLVGILVSGVLVVASIPLLLMFLSEAYLFVIIYAIIFVLAVVATTVLLLIAKYAISINVLENLSVEESIRKGYRMFRENWLVSLEAALGMFLINVLASFIFLVVLVILMSPIIIVSLVLTSSFLILATLIIILAILITFGALLTTFQISSWTILYLELKEGKGKAKLERLVKKKK